MAIYISFRSVVGCAYSSNSELVVNDGASVLSMFPAVASQYRLQIGCK